jgi:GDPmannose 4,6-dehydratase
MKENVKVYRESYNLFAIQGLLYNHESPRRGEEFVTRKITKQVARIKKQLDKNLDFIDPIELGNIYAKRDWSHSKDFVEGIWMMLNQEHPKEYLLASGKTHTVKEFVEKAFNFAGIKGYWGYALNEEPEEINEKFFSESNEILVKINPIFYRPAEVDLLLGNPIKAETELGWKQKISFENLIKEMIINDLM